MDQELEEHRYFRMLFDAGQFDVVELTTAEDSAGPGTHLAAGDRAFVEVVVLDKPRGLLSGCYAYRHHAADGGQDWQLGTISDILLEVDVWAEAYATLREERAHD